MKFAAQDQSIDLADRCDEHRVYETPPNSENDDTDRGFCLGWINRVGGRLGRTASPAMRPSGPWRDRALARLAATIP